MQAFLAVLNDLAVFAREVLFGKLSQRETRALPPARVAADSAVKSQEDYSIVPHHVKADAPSSVIPLFGQQSVFVQVKEARVFTRPVWAFDTVCAILPMATAVKVDSFEGRFAHIHTATVEGWVLKDELSLQVVDVWPVFSDLLVYDASHQVTERVRLIITDEFFARELYLPLQPQEFILSKLIARGQRLPSVATRPRLAGLWHTIYRGCQGVRIGLLPKTGAVMEMTSPTTMPFLALVTAVHVDGSLIVESVGRYQEGEYRTEIIKPADWHELRPVFIEF